MDINILRKRILYQALYRGTKENDLITRSFIQNYIEECNDEDLKNLEELLSFSDHDIFIATTKKNNQIYEKYKKIFQKFDETRNKKD